MNQKNSLVPASVRRALGDNDPGTLTPVAVYELATKVVAALDLIEAIIPDLRTPHPSTAGKVRGGRTVSRDAFAAIVTMVEAFPYLQQMTSMDLERSHEVLSFDDGFRVLDQRIERLRRQVAYTVEARWAEVVQPAMAAYAIAKRMAKQPRYAGLVAHVAVIGGHLDRSNKKTARKKKKETKPE